MVKPIQPSFCLVALLKMCADHIDLALWYGLSLDWLSSILAQCLLNANSSHDEWQEVKRPIQRPLLLLHPITFLWSKSVMCSNPRTMVHLLKCPSPSLGQHKKHALQSKIYKYTYIAISKKEKERNFISLLQEGMIDSELAISKAVSQLGKRKQKVREV